MTFADRNRAAMNANAPGNVNPPGEGSVQSTGPTVSQGVYTAPTSTVYSRPVTSAPYVPQSSSVPRTSSYEVVVPETQWIAGVSNWITVAAGLVVGYAVVKTMSGDARKNPSPSRVQGFLSRHGIHPKTFDSYVALDERGRNPSSRVRVEGIRKSGIAFLESKAAHREAKKLGLVFRVGLIDGEAFFQDSK